MHFAKYLKTAFLNRWNLLLLAGATGFALLSGRSDVWMPLVLATEVAYLGMLGTHPRFQAYVDAQQSAAIRQQGSAGVERMMASIMAALPPKSVERYEALRARCVELRQIALAIKYPGHASSASILEQSQLAGLDRLLWIYLRLLFTQHSLERFFQKTSEAQIQQDIDNLQVRLEKASKLRDEAQRQKFARTIEDNLETCRNRLSNYQKARSNYELIQLEIDRLENKIRSLSELAVNRQEPDFISGQVDQVAASMLETERTMNDLQFATGLATVDETAPQLLTREQVRQQ
ncbi:MAG: hypothetical protein GX616_08165 [Planctomycetes bacterium]|nr:hypothetical protein [Planctomycetota bacterium]